MRVRDWVEARSYRLECVVFSVARRRGFSLRTSYWCLRRHVVSWLARPAFLARDCHQGQSAGSTLGWGLEFTGLSVWCFLLLVVWDSRWALVTSASGDSSCSGLLVCFLSKSQGAGLRLGWGLNSPAWVCGIFWSSSSEILAGHVLEATRGVMVCSSAFLLRDCYQCLSAASRLGWGLNLPAWVCGIFWSSSLGILAGH